MQRICTNQPTLSSAGVALQIESKYRSHVSPVCRSRYRPDTQCNVFDTSIQTKTLESDDWTQLSLRWMMQAQPHPRAARGVWRDQKSIWLIHNRYPARLHLATLALQILHCECQCVHSLN